MFRKDPLFIPGWIYFFLMFPLASRLPESFGCENGIIENLQIFGSLAGSSCALPPLTIVFRIGEDGLTLFGKRAFFTTSFSS